MAMRARSTPCLLLLRHSRGRRRKPPPAQQQRQHSYPSQPTVTHHRRRPLVPPATDPQAFNPLARFLGLKRIEPGKGLVDFSKGQLIALLTTQDAALVQSLYASAEAATTVLFGTKVYARAIVEFSNVCTKDCLYCGIRKHMKVHRYTMTKEEILSCAKFAFEQGMGTLMLQSGELPTPDRLAFMLDVVQAVRQHTVELDLAKHNENRHVTAADLDKNAQRGLAVALSLGELPSDVYQAFYDAGAHRYLLRIETSNPVLYSKLHPPTHSYTARRHCLDELKRIGYQVGTGVMVGVPYQTVEDMAGDLLFFREFGADMVGLGPYVVQHETPLGQVWLAERAHFKPDDFEKESKALFDLTTRMYALARLLLGDVNIAATTALQVLNPSGREIALQRGANVVMPIITPKHLRENYQIYENKPCIDEDSLKCTGCLDLRVKLAGKELLLDGGWNDPPHYLHRHEEGGNKSKE